MLIEKDIWSDLVIKDRFLMVLRVYSKVVQIRTLAGA